MRRLSLSSNIEELEETIRLKTEELKQLEVEIARSSLNKEVSNEHQQKIPDDQVIDKFTKSKEVIEYLSHVFVLKFSLIL